MSTRAEVLELAILGQLQHAPMHGYELRKRLNTTLGTIRTLSYGSLYPCLKALVGGGWIEEAETGALPHALAGRRARIVYRLTTPGKQRLADSLAQAGPAAWEDESFTVRFSLFTETDSQTRLQILEGRRARMLQRKAAMRQQVQAGRERRDHYTQELQRHGLDLIDREIGWLEDLIVAERTEDPTEETPEESS
ncbi:PadR family transcriptional regulator [Ruania zhangjianzhongii]|uniref:PadR family transcriptional regulator n=1 Tax=Ruania zhangjianzhongii TaxID=2603206 RepID=UPI0011C71A1A|nr:PadR family transcriptional regulator [Ruania zhangjianzhongii]